MKKSELKQFIRSIIEESTKVKTAGFETIIMHHVEYTRFKSKNKKLEYVSTENGIDIKYKHEIIAKYDMKNEVLSFDASNDIFDNTFILTTIFNEVTKLLNINIIESLSDSDKEKMITLLSDFQSINTRL